MTTIIVLGVLGFLYFKAKAAESQVSQQQDDTSGAAQTSGTVTSSPTNGVQYIGNPAYKIPIGAPIGQRPIILRDSYLSNKVGGILDGNMRCGGGGPENAGAISSNNIVTKLPLSQPSWWWEADNDYFGYAVKSVVPQAAGGGLDQPQDAARWLGDNFGGRQ